MKATTLLAKSIILTGFLFLDIYSPSILGTLIMKLFIGAANFYGKHLLCN